MASAFNTPAHRKGQEMQTLTNDSIRDLVAEIRWTRACVTNCRESGHLERLVDEIKYLATCERELLALISSKYANNGTAPMDDFGQPACLKGVANEK